MTIQWLSLSLFTLWPVCALAQTPTSMPVAKTAPTNVVEPAAQALLDRAVQNYKGLSGISYTTEWRSYGKKGLGPVRLTFTRYSRPNKLSVSTKGWWSPNPKVAAVSDGTYLYTTQMNSKYYRSASSPQAMEDHFGDDTIAGDLIGAMLMGNNPLPWAGGRFSNNPSIKPGPVVALGARVIDGDVLQGVRYTFSADETSVFDDSVTAHTDAEVTAWFGGTPLLLHRVQFHTSEQSGHKMAWSSFRERLTDQQLNSSFAPETFQWNATGLTLSTPEADAAERAKEDTAEQAEEEKRQHNARPNWDARLKVGTAPFDFSTTDLQGRTITPAKYKGKVLLLDFWATWCAPCVAGLPELRAAYDKYHKQGLEVVGISVDVKKQALTSFIQERKITWTQIYDGEDGRSQIADKYGVQAIPFLLLIGKDGKIAAVNPRGDIDKAVKSALTKG